MAKPPHNSGMKSVAAFMLSEFLSRCPDSFTNQLKASSAIWIMVVRGVAEETKLFSHLKEVPL
jgi:hypothetical protein